jgi:hypothetical protein
MKESSRLYIKEIHGDRSDRSNQDDHDHDHFNPNDRLDSR